MARINPCTPEVRRGRLVKANQFIDAATAIAGQNGTEADIADAFVTLCVHAGIAAADKRIDVSGGNWSWV